LLSWGVPGDGAGEFDTPHSIALDGTGRLYVADRGNSRIQLFDTDGRFLGEWKDRRRIGRPWAVRIGEDGFVYVVDGGDQGSFPPERARVLKLDMSGRVVDSFGSYGRQPGQLIWPHALALDEAGTVYVGEVSTGMRVQKFVVSEGQP
jgi:DNA-binding beta-propeller fold protein YncE